MSDVGRSVWRLATRAIVLVVVILLLWFLGPTIWDLFSPFLLAIPVALLLQKPIRWSEKKLHFKHGISVAVWVVLVCAAIVALLYWILSSVITQIVSISGNYQTIISDFINLLRNVVNQIFEALNYMPESVEEWIRSALNDIFAQISVGATNLIGVVLNFAITFVSSIPYGLIYLNFLLLGIFFITSDYSKMRMRIFDRMGDSMRDRSEMISGSAGHGMSAYVKVQFLYGVLVFIVCWPCLSFFGIPYASLIAGFAALLEFMPIFGNGTLFIPWAIICYIINLPTLGTQLLVMHLALFIFRKVTEPKLMSNQMGLSPLLSLIAMFVGMRLGGVLGLILAPVGVVVLQSAWHGGIFQATIADVRTLYAHLRSILADPPREGTEQPSPAAPAQSVPKPTPATQEKTQPQRGKSRKR